MSNTINIIIAGDVPSFIIEEAKAVARRTTDLYPRVNFSSSDSLGVWLSHRATNQRNADDILFNMAMRGNGNHDRTVAILSDDMAPERMTFAYGYAHLKMRVAIVSVARLYNSFYGLPECNKTTIDRFRTVLRHELVHTYGVKHCQNWNPSSKNCLMRSMSEIESLDTLGPKMCLSCRDTFVRNKRGYIVDNIAVAA